MVLADYTMSGSAVLPTKIMAMMMVIMNIAFSDPRLFTLPVSETSPPPNAPPTPASLRCIRIVMISSIALTTCTTCMMNAVSTLTAVSPL